MRPPEGRQFDLRPVDDGRPAINVRQRGGLAGKIILLIAAAVAAVVGFGFGASSVGRRMYNQANFGAKRVKVELEGMQKTISQIRDAVTMSRQRLIAAHQDPLSYDPKLITDLQQVPLDPRPDTSRIFKVNYYLLSDLTVDHLMNYYYDAIALYGEVERHIKRTNADKASLQSYAAKVAQKGEDSVNYGIVFSSTGKTAIGTLVELGRPVCKGGADTCPASQYEGFMIRANTGASWTPRKIGPRPEGDKVVPIQRTPFFDAVMNGSPDQVRMEQYRERCNNIRQLLSRLTLTGKDLMESINKAADRPDLFTF